jgi:putative membrane protein
MNGIFIRWLTLTGAIIFTSYLLDGIQVSGFLSAFFAAAILGILNALFRPILILLTLPINILTLGFFTFVINALMLKMASAVIAGFDVYGFWSAIFGSLIISTTDRRTRYPNRGRPENRSKHENDTIDLENKGDDHWE